jgi:hypothetical protein
MAFLRQSGTHSSNEKDMAIIINKGSMFSREHMRSRKLKAHQSKRLKNGLLAN